MRLLVLNANSTQAITDIVAAEARRAARADTEIVAATSIDGPPFIASRADNEAAVAPALATARRHADFIAAGGTSSALDPPIIAAAERLVAQGADAVLLPSAALAPVARRIQPRLPVPVLDGIACGVKLCEAVAGLAPR